jgi:hypothetical protein
VDLGLERPEVMANWSTKEILRLDMGSWAAWTADLKQKSAYEHCIARVLHQERRGREISYQDISEAG